MDFVVELIDEILLKLQFLKIYRYCIERNFVHDFTHPYNFGFKVLIMFSIDNISKSIFRHKFEWTNKVITSLLNYILSIWYSLSKTYHFQRFWKLTWHQPEVNMQMISMTASVWKQRKNSFTFLVTPRMVNI